MPSGASIQLDSLARKSTDERRGFTHRVTPARRGLSHPRLTGELLLLLHDSEGITHMQTLNGS